METKTRMKRRAFIRTNDCVACGCCARVCPLSAVQVWRGIYAKVDPERCVGCGKCAKECPASVIAIQEVRG
ncbi:MAG: 4Fe-4S binding protein [Lawsonibacter sp.]|jgi:ferredoxin|nr:4Fe-4S binding protein [Lawsonibacter sp.]